MNEHLQLGVVGYAYQQLSGDSGQGAVLGPFESRVFGIGPEIGTSSTSTTRPRDT
ncbi:transporter [Pseudaminobacter soli (ex Li et al. 2025)]|uniref:transporter n=1 Tax=Pseudaminobacter soli (ex Li et al. 2025) TaxID=1295366 RepID=UPI001FE093CF|nr:transporter [Mesorhizobium soli]